MAQEDASTPSVPARRRRRHSIRAESGRFAPAGSLHHGAVQSHYPAAQLSRTRDFTPDQDPTVTPQGRK